MKVNIAVLCTINLFLNLIYFLFSIQYKSDRIVGIKNFFFIIWYDYGLICCILA